MQNVYLRINDSKNDSYRTYVGCIEYPPTSGMVSINFPIQQPGHYTEGNVIISGFAITDYNEFVMLFEYVGEGCSDFYYLDSKSEKEASITLEPLANIENPYKWFNEQVRLILESK